MLCDFITRNDHSLHLVVMYDIIWWITGTIYDKLNIKQFQFWINSGPSMLVKFIKEHKLETSLLFDSPTHWPYFITLHKEALDNL